MCKRASTHILKQSSRDPSHIPKTPLSLPLTPPPLISESRHKCKCHHEEEEEEEFDLSQIFVSCRFINESSSVSVVYSHAVVRFLVVVLFASALKSSHFNGGGVILTKHNNVLQCVRPRFFPVQFVTWRTIRTHSPLAPTDGARISLPPLLTTTSTPLPPAQNKPYRFWEQRT